MIEPFHASISNIKARYSDLSTAQLRKKRRGFIELQKFHSLAKNRSTVGYYNRLISVIDDILYSRIYGTRSLSAT